MKAIIQKYKPTIDERITLLFRNGAFKEYSWSTEIIDALVESIIHGKTVRGSLFLAAIELFEGEISDDMITLAAILECFHTAFLIHDDVIDHDDVRRGLPSIHKTFQTIALSKNMHDPQEFGQGIAIVIGDIAIFSALSFLNTLSIEPKLFQSIHQLLMTEYLRVGFGESHDIILGYQTTYPTTQEVLDMYTNKTARYTFSLPLILAAICTHQPENIIQKLETIGIKLGIIYQLTDDQLTLSGDVSVVGKTIGNDIAENKKTMYATLLHEAVSPDDLNRIKAIFGNTNISEASLLTIRELLQTYGILDKINQMTATLSEEAVSLIKELSLPNEKKELFSLMLNYLKTRVA